MCLMAFDWQPDSPQGECLLLIGNRDEFHARATAGLCVWPDGVLCGGRDLVAGGGWLVMHPAGSLATLTNVRQLDHPAPTASISRGQLVAAAARQALGRCSRWRLEDWLRALVAGESVPAALEGADAQKLSALTLEAVDWCNLLVCDGKALWRLHHGPQGAEVSRLGAGVHSLSNGHPETDWPKQRRLSGRLAALLDPSARAGQTTARPLSDDALLDLLKDDWRPAPTQLPATGLSPEREALLSSPFIVSAEYGTRASTLVRWQRHPTRDTADPSGVVQTLTLLERRFSPEGHTIASRRAMTRLLATGSDEEGDIGSWRLS
ncbi:MAG: NRDE family protein [Cobetia amphilecti]